MSKSIIDTSAVTRVGLDLAKRVFRVHAVDATGKVVIARSVNRRTLLTFFDTLPRCVVAMEACSSAHHWGRQLQALGFTVKLIPPAHVKPYVRRNKNDAADAAAICEAAGRPGQRFVPVRSVENQAALMRHRARELMVGQRTAALNALRGHLSEIGSTADVLMVVCDGLKGLPDAVNAVWDKAIVQTCIVHLLRNSFKYASKKDWGAIAKDLRPVYTAVSESAALDRFAEFSGKWEKKYPAIIRLWENAWAEFTPFLQFDNEIRKVICTTNAIESINARLRRAVNARGHFPTEQAAMKCLYMAVMSLDPTGKGRKRWTNRWKAALNAFDITFDGRLSAGRK